MKLSKFVAILAWASFFVTMWLNIFGVRDTALLIISAIFFLALALIAGLASASEPRPLRKGYKDETESTKRN